MDRWDTLVFTWSVAGTTTIQWNDETMAYAHKSHLDDYTRGLKKRVLQLAPVYTELSIVRWLEVVEEDIRGRAIEYARTLFAQMPWGMALVRAQADMADSWQQHKNFLKHKSNDVGMPKGERPSKGVSKGAKTLDVKLELSDPHFEPLKLKEADGRKSKGHPPTCSQFKGDLVCKPWDDVRCCSGRCLLNRLHVCDIKMANGQMCASKKTQQAWPQGG